MTAEASDQAAGLAWYVYGVIDAADTAAVPAGPGTDAAHPVATVTEAPLAAIVSMVGLATFDTEPIRRQLEDLAWVERIARAHEGVLESLPAEVTVVPMRMCTVYRTEERLRLMLRDGVRPLGDALERFAGRSEWGVKAFAEPPVPGAGTSDERPASGTDYLLARRRQRDAAAAAGRRAEEIAGEIHATVQQLATAARLGRPQSAELTGQPGRMLLNGSYLIEDAAADDFHALVAQLAEHYAAAGVAVTPTGPWPPYNFVPDTLGGHG